MDQAESDNVEASYTCLLEIGVSIMSKLYECSECGELFTKHEIDWEDSDESYESYYCHDCSRFLEQCGMMQWILMDLAMMSTEIGIRNG